MEFGKLELPEVEGAKIYLSENNSALTEYPFISTKRAQKLWKRAMKLHPDVASEEEAFEMYPSLGNFYGKPAKMNRGVGFYSDESEGYRYSGQISRSKALLGWQSNLLNKVNEMFDTSFNGILLNFYPDGEHYIGPHSDDESALSKKGIVVALSLGAERIFRIRNLAKKIIKFDGEEVKTVNGRLIVMSGDFQKHYTHEVPKQTKIKEPRISLTFREHRA